MLALLADHPLLLLFIVAALGYPLGRLKLAGFRLGIAAVLFVGLAMGAHGASRFDAYFLGGVAGRFVRRSAVPVLTVREEVTTIQVNRILVATDFGPAARRAWEFCQTLAANGIKLAVAHVSDKREAAKTREVVTKLEAFTAGTDVRHVIREGNPIHALPRIAGDVGADVIAIGVRQHSSAVGLLLGSRADALLRSSPVPILSVPHREA